MKLREWDEKIVKWDDHKKYHMRFYGEWHTPLFTQFEDGSMMLRQGGVKPDHRRVYKDIGIQIVAGRDQDCPKLMMPDGRKVPNAWIKHETLVIDLATRFVVTKRSARGSYAGALPDYAKRASVYWPYEGARPWGGKVQLIRPKKLTKGEKNRITTLRAACSAWYAFSGNDASYVRPYYTPVHTWTSDALLRYQFTELSNDDRRSIATNSYATSPQHEVVDYLLLAED